MGRRRTEDAALPFELRSSALAEHVLLTIGGVVTYVGGLFTQWSMKAIDSILRRAAALPVALVAATWAPGS